MKKLLQNFLQNVQKSEKMTEDKVNVAEDPAKECPPVKDVPQEEEGEVEFDFRHLVRIDGNVEEAVKTLSMIIIGDANALDGVDLNFLKDFDYITAVPIQIALSYVERANLIKGNPNINFIITGIDKEWVPTLQKMGYVAWEVEKTEEVLTGEEVLELTPDNGKVSIYGKVYDVADIIEALDLRQRVDAALNVATTRKS